MNFLNLKYFLVLAEDLSFSRSAAKLHISQQSLSAHIHKLETECGLQLFYREPPLRLTFAGEEFAKSAHVIMAEKEFLEKKLASLLDCQQGNIAIGVPISRGTILLPRVLAHFHQEFPYVKVHLVEGSTNEISQELLRGRTDLNLGFETEDSERIESNKLYLERTKIVVPNSILETLPDCESMPETQTALSLRTFAACPFVSLHESTLTGSVLSQIAREESFTPNIVMDTGNLLTMLSLCCEGLGICICPNSFLIDNGPLINTAFLERVTIFDMKSDLGTQWIVANRLKRKYHSLPEKRLLKIIRDTYTDV